MTQIRRDVPLQDFPSLFIMEGHTGLLGVFFAAIWFAMVALYVPTTVTHYWFLAVAICGAFFVLSWISLFQSSYFSKKMAQASLTSASPDVSKIERRARRSIPFLSASYVVVFAVLIWLTGGATSPFVPLYVIIFTITISRIRFAPHTFVVAAFFLFAIAVACYARAFSTWPFSRIEAKQIQESELGTAIHLFFICASLVVPTLSAYFVSLQSTRQLLEDLRQTEDFDVGP